MKKYIKARHVFVACFFGLWAQFIFAKVSAEPFPGWVYPTFETVPDKAGEMEVTEPTVTAVFADGAQLEVDAEQLFSGPHASIRNLLMRRTFPTPSTLDKTRPEAGDAEATASIADLFRRQRPADYFVHDSPEMRRWLSDEIAKLADGRRPVRIRSAWTTTTFDAHTGEKLRTQVSEPLVISLNR